MKYMSLAVGAATICIFAASVSADIPWQFGTAHGIATKGTLPTRTQPAYQPMPFVAPPLVMQAGTRATPVAPTTARRNSNCYAMWVANRPATMCF